MPFYFGGEMMDMDIMFKNLVIESFEFEESDIAEKYLDMKEESDE